MAPSETAAPPTPSALPRWNALAWLAVLTLLAFTATRAAFGDERWLLLVWGAYTPFVLLPAYATLAYGLARAQRALTLLSLGLVALHLVRVVPQIALRAPSDARPRSALRVATVNGNGWNERPELTLLPLERQAPDLVCLQELSPAWADGLRDEGFLDEYPHQHLVVREGVWGMGLLSRYPLHDVRAHDLNEAPAIEAGLTHEGRTLRVLCVHPAPPAGDLLPSHLDALRQILAWTEAHREVSAVVLGDLNSTPYSRFSDAMRAYVSDAWELAGARGFGHTWPNNGMLYPPARLDHIYVTPSLGVAHADLGLPGLSDHAPLVADIVLRDAHQP
ncbi:MAG: endonuclease/exonuclease/phosphatase family protein [Polyangiales bacterium]